VENVHPDYLSNFQGSKSCSSGSGPSLTRNVEKRRVNTTSDLNVSEKAKACKAKRVVY